MTACSKDSASPPATSLQEIKEATFAAGSAAYHGEVRFADGSSGPIDGTAAAAPSKGDVTTAVSSADGPRPTELVWVDGTLYIRRAVGSTPAGATGTGGVFLRSDGDRPWVRLQTTGIGQALLVPYDPFVLLDQLSAVGPGVSFRADGTETVSGRALDRFAVDAQGDGGGILPGIPRAELVADGNHRLVLVRLLGEQTIEYTLSEFGTEVSVTPPPDDQIALPQTVDNSEDPTGEYVQVASGVVDGVVWQVVRAPATGAGTCWRLDMQGQSDPIAPTEQDGATCLAAIDPAIDEPVLVVADTGSLAPLDGIVAVVPSGSQAVVRFVDGSSQKVPVDPSGFVVWVGPKDPMLVVLDVTLPDGNPEACGPGSISTLDDLDTIAPQDVPGLRDAPWLCLAG